MNLELKNLPEKITPLLSKVKQYAVFIFIIVILASYGFLVFRIDSLASTEPRETEVFEQLKTVQRPKIDENSINKIKQLEDQNIEVQTIFTQARSNPFAE